MLSCPESRVNPGVSFAGVSFVKGTIMKANMTKLAMLLTASTFWAALCTPLTAQWIGLKKTPDLSSPAPRMPDGKPDFSGIWEHMDARDKGYYLNGIDIPWKPWAAGI